MAHNPLAAGLIGRVLVSALVLIHLTASVANFFRDTDVGRDLRKHTRKYETALGLSQNWNMFAPNPPRSSIWLETKGLTENGDWIDVPRTTENASGPVRMRYWRGGKEERYLFMDEKKGLRRRKTKRLCAHMEAAGTPIVAVKYRRAWLRTPKPEDARAGQAPKLSGKDLEQYSCKR
jgi:hypothetical protein